MGELRGVAHPEWIIEGDDDRFEVMWARLAVAHPWERLRTRSSGVVEREIVAARWHFDVSGVLEEKIEPVFIKGSATCVLR